MKHLLHSLALRVTMLIALLVSFGSSGAWGQTDNSAIYSSNVSLSGGNSCTVVISSTNYDGTKLGSSGKGGSCTFSAPAGTKYIHIHVAAWNGKSTSFSYKVGSGSATNLSITSNSGIANSSPFTFSGDASSSSYYKVITLETPLANAATITLTSASERCVIWGVNTEIGSNKTDAGLTFGDDEGETFTVLPSSSFTAKSLSNPNSLTVSYSTTDSDIADVNSSTGAITIGTKEGTATITASSTETETYDSGSASYSITVAKGTTAVTLNSTALSFNIVDGTTQTLTANAKYNETTLDSPAITWESSNTSVATVSGGVVTAVAPGSATITANYGGNTVYKSSSKTCSVTVNKANTVITLTTSDATTIDLKPANKANVNLSVNVKAIKTDETQVAVASPVVTWESTDATVATVSDGVVTGLKVGSTTIKAKYAGGTNYNAATDATLTITVTDTRDAVNMESFSATNSSVVIGNTTATTITNDKDGWSAAYTYSSSNTSIATVAADGKVTAVAKGTATITATLNVAADDANYKAGETTSKTIDITVTKPFHTVTFSVNGNTGLTASVEEDQAITFPTAVETTPGDNEFSKVINGQTFVGWYTTTYSNASVAPSYVNTASTNMGDGNVTYYAVYADYIAAVHDYVTDELTPSGISNPSSYGNWSGKTATSSAVYAGNSTGGTSKIQINSDNPRGIVSTTSGGRIDKVTLVWDSSTSSGRTVQVYGSNTAYSSSADLYDISKRGTSLGTIVYGTSTELDITGDYEYVGLRSSSNALYLTSVTIKWDKGTPASYKNFTTTVSALPRPEISMSNVEMTWGESGKSVFATATVDDAAYDGTFTYSCEDANMTVNSSTGALSCNVPGSYYVKASIAATGDHQAAEKTCVVTVNKKNVTLSFANATVIKMVTDETKSYTQTATADPAVYDGTISYAISGSGSSTINTSTAAVTYTATTGVNTITATAPATDLYNGETATYTFYVKTTPTITVSDQTLAVGETYEPTVTGGTLSITSDPASVISVEGGVITASAVISGATVTVSTAANDTYIAGEETFTLNVTAPTGASSSSDAKTTELYESFDKSTGTDGWSSSAGNGTANFDNDGWVTTNSVGGGATCIKLAASKTSGAVTTPNLTVESGVTYTLTFKAGSWSGDGSSLTLAGTNTGTLSQTNLSLSNAAFGNYTVTFTPSSNSSSAKIQFSAASGKRLFLDEVRITRPITSTSVTTNGGYATYCYQYPLNLDGISGAKAYKVSEIDLEKEKVRLTQITGTIKGGVPFILMSDGDDATFDIPLADESSTVPASNLLVGTLAPTFVAQTSGDYTNFAYSKSNECFVKLGATGNTVPANRAYLPINLGGGSSVKAFTLSFDTETGITEAAQNTKGTESLFDLSGRRVSKAQKGLYILNGRKVLVK